MKLRKIRNSKRKKEDEALRQKRDRNHLLLGSIALDKEHSKFKRLNARVSRELADIFAKLVKLEREIQRRNEVDRDCERAEKERLQREKMQKKHKHEMKLRKIRNSKRKKEDEALRQKRDRNHLLLGSIALDKEHSKFKRCKIKEKRKHDGLLKTRKKASIRGRIGAQQWEENKKKREETAQSEELKKSLEAWSSRTGISYLSFEKLLAFESDSKIPAYFDVSSSKHVSQDVVVGTVRPTKALNIRSGRIGVDSESLPSRSSQMNVTSDRIYSIKMEEDPRHNLSFVSTTHDRSHVMGGISRSFKHPDSTRVSQVYKGGESHDVQLIDDVRAGSLREKSSELRKAQSRGKAALREQNKVKSIQMLVSLTQRLRKRVLNQGNGRDDIKCRHDL
ncbi:hypothetical protein ADUPG1_008756 [Aduncisulcus paluster]|uniref:Uncharacterized protein n=1 Tax=Aduncisulcus paluster TaxID=2918883 RepID=A0ABQ5KW24_9EUKA|nr:hypothetical protein ADUPG1_008756 [Aduncisulcus paluster]